MHEDLLLRSIAFDDTNAVVLLVDLAVLSCFLQFGSHMLVAGFLWHNEHVSIT